MEPRKHWGTGALTPPDPDDDDHEPCPGCGDGDKVSAKGYWVCPVCDAEWKDEDEDVG